MLKAEQDVLCRLDWDRILIFLKDLSSRMYDVDSIIHAALKIKKHRVMERIYTPEEIHDIAANGGTVPRTMLPSLSSESLNSAASSSSESRSSRSDGSDEKPSMLKQISQSNLPKRTMTSAPSSPSLGNKSPRQDPEPDSSVSSEEEGRARSRSRSFGDKPPLSHSASSPHIYLTSSSNGDSSIDDRTASASLTPNPYHFGTPYFANSRVKKPQQLEIIDSDPSGKPILSLSPKSAPGAAPPRPLSTAVSMSAFDLTALEKARANASAISTSHHLRFRTTLDTDAASNLPASIPESGSQSSRVPSSRRLGIPTLGMPSIPEDGDDSGASRGSRSAPSSPRKAVSINRDEMSSALADMLAVTAETPSTENGFAPSTSNSNRDTRITSDNYSDYLSASLSMDNVRTSVPVPFASPSSTPAANEDEEARAAQSM
jgi:hypothetical protein